MTPDELERHLERLYEADRLEREREWIGGMRVALLAVGACLVVVGVLLLAAALLLLG